MHGAAGDLPSAHVPHRAPIPHAWAIEALNESIATDAGPAQVASKLWVLAAFGAALLAASTVLLRRTLTVRR
jgi:hypothetical protein